MDKAEHDSIREWIRANYLPIEGFDLKSAVHTLKRDFVTQALKRTGGNVTEAAVLLRLKRQTLHHWIKELGIYEGG